MTITYYPEFLDSSRADVDDTASLQGLLMERARARCPRSLLFYPKGDTSTPVKISYKELYHLALRKSVLIRPLPNFKLYAPILLHLDDQYDAILWFWAVLLADGVPVMSPPFSSVEEHRASHINNLSTLLESPICITRARDLHLFNGSPHSMHIHTIEELCEEDPDGRRRMLFGRSNLEQDTHVTDVYQGGGALAMLMLTSGSTGNAKAVCLTHRQVLSAVRGKSEMRALPPGRPFLNWIGLDHVASLIEIHIPALWLDADQIHVHASDVVPSPRVFLDLLTKHRVCRTFAPNFFLARLAMLQFDEKWDLRDLTLLTSGGEANDLKTCLYAFSLFRKCGAFGYTIAPGFGMTETCAGCIYNLDCLTSEVNSGWDITSVGKCINGVELRITRNAHLGSTTLAARNEPGHLEVRGPVVFKGYYRQPQANSECFTPDGWFRTGDEGLIDERGNLRLIGRAKDVFNINGVKIPCSDVQSHVEKATALLVSRIICFPSRDKYTERITIAYIPLQLPNTGEEYLIHIENLIIQACYECSGSFPILISLRGESAALVPTSALGKISRSKMSALFQEGYFAECIREQHQETEKRVRKEQIARSQTDSRSIDPVYQQRLFHEISEAIGIHISRSTSYTSLFELGITSLDLIHLKHRLETRLHIEVPISMLLKNTSAADLSAALYTSDSTPPSYDPVVTLQPVGTKTPLWLVHPGVGEVLVFVGLAQCLRDECRPVYALRARGFEGQEPFKSVEEAVESYVAAILSKQPYGPYALAGYSYGTMLAFEIAKKLRASGGTVRFLGNFNLPPHIKMRMRQLDWHSCLLHLSYFMGLISEDLSTELEQTAEFSALPRPEAVRRVLEVSDPNRLEELGLKEHNLMQWVRVSYGLLSLAVDYEPRGKVDGMDIFHAVPIKTVALSREEWVGEHLSKWSDFCDTQPIFHEVGGAHYTMLGEDHLAEFTGTLKAALLNRGL
ncbi:hypothetical protein NPX13_g7745 [Xylaria arbuscula]|uniref:Carrier domain-containing protein n=1 Tax=Xylaria arbuscula TaxID=114810 RepID=A0A9W8NA10_9PEZI|nr:hypothetical protein NPX13_g7745 [Xylaria arbuscula]